MYPASVPAYSFGDVTVTADSQVITPAGSSWLAETELELGSPTSITTSTPTWNPAMVVVSIIVGFITCGLGLLLLFLSRSIRIDTVVMDTVTLKAPGYHYISQGYGGAQFVSWAGTWRQQLAVFESNRPTIAPSDTSLGNPYDPLAIASETTVVGNPTQVLSTETEVLADQPTSVLETSVVEASVPEGGNLTQVLSTETAVFVDQPASVLEGSVPEGGNPTQVLSPESDEGLGHSPA